MSKGKHTPGPWKYDDIWSLIVGPQGERQQICAIHGSEAVTREQASANAALIAAAPELLDALRAIIDLQGKAANGLPLSENEMREWAAANFNARAAIAQAEGRS